MTIKKKVLICDDDRDFGKLLVMRLSNAGFDVRIALDAFQVLQMARKEKPDCIVLDVNMPGGNVEGTLKKLEQNAQTLTIPVVLMSGQKPDWTKLGELHEANFLKKPFDANELIKTIYRLTGTTENAEIEAAEGNSGETLS